MTIQKDIKIRIANENDAEELGKLICANAEVLLKPHYSPQQWDIFISYYSREVMIDKILNQNVFCATLEGKIVGTVSLDKDFVVGFYTHLDYLNQGIGKLLMNYLEAFASAQGLKAIQLAASPVGVTFYIKHGWQKINDLVIEYLGVGFEETLMEKRLE